MTQDEWFVIRWRADLAKRLERLDAAPSKFHHTPAELARTMRRLENGVKLWNQLQRRPRRSAESVDNSRRYYRERKRVLMNIPPERWRVND